MNTPNKDRIINIKWRGGTESNNDWRCALSRLNSLSSRDYPYSILGSSLFNNTTTDVDKRVCLLMTSSPKTMRTSNDVKQPIQELLKGASNSTVGKIAGAITTGLNVLNASIIDNGETASTWQPWMVGVKSWDGSKGGFSFEYEFSFAMGQYGLWNAREEVVKPILNLIAPALPRSMDNFSMNGPFPTAIQLLSLLVQNSADAILDKMDDISFKDATTGAISHLGDSFRNNIAEEGLVKGVLVSSTDAVNGVLRTISDELNAVIQESYKGYTYNVSFGNFVTFNDMIITNGETSFSNEVDQYGYPIAGSVKLTFEGLVPLAMSYSDSSLVAIKYGV